MQIIRVFLACPSDVSAERIKSKEIVDEINTSLGNFFSMRIELLVWGDSVTGGMGRPQELINKQVDFEKIDIFIGILWTRFGTRTGGSDKETGRLYESGTEEEFQIVYDLWKKKKCLDILFYQSSASISPSKLDINQLQKINSFFDRFDHDRENPGLYYRYKSKSDFEKKLRTDLIRLVVGNLKRKAVSSKIDSKEGFTNLFTSSSNEERNNLKKEAVLNSKKILLTAHTGHSYLAIGGARYRQELIRQLDDGVPFYAILTHPWSFSGYRVALNELVSVNPNTNFYTIENSGLKYDLEKILESNPLELVESSYGYAISLMNSLRGYEGLKKHYGDLIQIRFTRELLCSTILITDVEAFYEPYMYSPFPERNKSPMTKFEVKMNDDSYFFRYLRSHVQTLWQNSEPIECFREHEFLYKEKFSRLIQMNLENYFV